MSASVSAYPHGPGGGRSPWFFNAGFDFLTVGGLSVLLILFFTLFQYDERSENIRNAAVVGSFLVNYPHYAATYYRVYRSDIEIRKYAPEAIYIPLLLMGLAVACFFAPHTIAPWYIKIYLVLSGWHYSGQTYGIALVYAGKKGFVFNNWQRYCVWLLVYFSFFKPMIGFEAYGPGGGSFNGIALPAIAFPEWLGHTADNMFWGSLVFYAFMVGYFRVTKGQWLPGIVHVIISSQLIWFVFGASNFAYTEFVPFFHCLQYLLVTTYFHFKDVSGEKDVDSSNPSGFFGTGSFFKYYVALIGLGAVLFKVIPEVLTKMGVSNFPLTEAIVISFINLHHFVLDGAIWRLRKPEIRDKLS